MRPHGGTDPGAFKGSWLRRLLAPAGFLAVGCLALTSGLARAATVVADERYDSSVGIPALSDFATSRNLAIGLSGLSASWVALQFEDADASARFIDEMPLEMGADAGNVYGDIRFMAAGTAGLWVTGGFARSRKMTHAAESSALSLGIVQLPVFLLKGSVDRERPNGRNRNSFPSGHTASAFSVAPVLMREFGWKIGVPAYALAVSTALGRMEDSHHYLSDVIFGATLGYVVGETVAHRRADHGLIDHISVDSRGVGLKVGF